MIRVISRDCQHLSAQERRYRPFGNEPLIDTRNYNVLYGLNAQSDNKVCL